VSGNLRPAVRPAADRDTSQVTRAAPAPPVLAMAFKLIESAQTRRQAVNATQLVALVRTGAVFRNGKLIERPDESEGGDQQAALAVIAIVCWISEPTSRR
jgi:hypothetical protein